MRVLFYLRLVAAMSALAFGALVAHAPVAHAEAPLRPHQVPGYYRLMVGDFEVTALYDGGVGIDSALLRGNAQQIRALLRRAMYEDPTDVLGSVAGYLVNTGSKLVLIDVGTGGHWGGPTLGRLVANLRASGYSPDQVDVVLITHLHADHVGGIYGADGSRVFRNAEIRMAKADSDFWLSTDIASKAPPDAQAFFKIARDAAAPYVAAGKWRPFEGTDAIVPGVRPYPIVGHTPGHMGYDRRRGSRSWCGETSCTSWRYRWLDPASVSSSTSTARPAIKAREALFAKLAASKTLVAGAHMPFPSLGYLRREGSGYAWIPVVFKDLSTTASAELSEARARELIAPWYGLFNQPVAADTVKAVHEQLLSPAPASPRPWIGGGGTTVERASSISSRRAGALRRSTGGPRRRRGRSSPSG